MTVPPFLLSPAQREQISKWYNTLKSDGRFDDGEGGRLWGIVHYEYHVTGDDVQLRVREGRTNEVLFLTNNDPFSSHGFGMNETERKRFERWLADLKQTFDFSNDPPQLVFEFTPNGIGEGVVVREKITREEIDVTDNSNW